MLRNIMDIEGMSNNKDNLTKTTVTKTITTRLTTILSAIITLHSEIVLHCKHIRVNSLQQLMKRWDYPAILIVSSIITLYSEKSFTNKH